jgi:hypothetical protein
MEPTDATAAVRRAELHVRLAGAYLVTAPARAKRAILRGIEEARAWRVAHGDEPALVHLTATLQVRLGLMHAGAGDLDAAVQTLAEAAEAFVRLREGPAEVRRGATQELIEALQATAEIELARGRPDEAWSSVERARPLLAEFLATRSEDRFALESATQLELVALRTARARGRPDDVRAAADRLVAHASFFAVRDDPFADAARAAIAEAEARRAELAR